MDPRTLWSWFRTASIVTIVSLAIWLLAESRMVQTRPLDLRISLVDRPDDPDRPLVVRPAPGEVWEPSVEVELVGSLASLDAASDELEGVLELRVGREIPSEVGRHTLDLRGIVREHPVLRERGVSVRSISSVSIAVEVDEIIETPLDVRIELPEGTRLDGVPRAEPGTVTVRGPRSVVAAVRGQPATASPTERTINALATGQFQVIPDVAVQAPPVPVSLGPDWVPTIEPSRVEVRLTLASRTATITIDRLPIQVLIAPGETGRWSIGIVPGDEDLVGVELEGPDDELSRIADGTTRPFATIPLSFQELERGIDSKRPLLLGLPPGVRVRSELPEIGLDIQRVEAVRTRPGSE